MNTYSKYCPNVFVAKCTEKHEKGDTIILETKYGKENECIVFNLVDIEGLNRYKNAAAGAIQYWEKQKEENNPVAEANIQFFKEALILCQTKIN